MENIIHNKIIVKTISATPSPIALPKPSSNLPISHLAISTNVNISANTSTTDDFAYCFLFFLNRFTIELIIKNTTNIIIAHIPTINIGCGGGGQKRHHTAKPNDPSAMLIEIIAVNIILLLLFV